MREGGLLISAPRTGWLRVMPAVTVALEEIGQTAPDPDGALDDLLAR